MLPVPTTSHEWGVFIFGFIAGGVVYWLMNRSD